MQRLIAVFLLVWTLAIPVLATGEITSIITAEDRKRLNDFELTRAAALSEARAGGSVADKAVLEDALSGDALKINDFDATGAWRCRTIKVGGLLPLTVYPWFKCRITDDGSGYLVEKFSGSQLTKGRLFTDSDTRLIYLGAGYVSGEKSRAYNEDAEHNQVAYVFRRGDARLVFEFPAPKLESKLDVMVLERQ